MTCIKVKKGERGNEEEKGGGVIAFFGRGVDAPGKGERKREGKGLKPGCRCTNVSVRCRSVAVTLVKLAPVQSALSLGCRRCCTVERRFVDTR